MPKATNQSHKKNWGSQVAHGVARKADLGNTNTPEAVALAVVEAAIAPWFDLARGGRWCEPAVGTGNFYLAMLTLVEQRGGDPLAFAQRFDGVDIDGEALAVLRQRLQARFGWDAATVSALPLYAVSLVDFTPTAPYEGIVTNPPYLSPKNWANTAEARAAMLARWQAVVPDLSARADLFMYFFGWAHRHLAPNGRSVFLCADGWLDAEYGAPLRAAMQGPDVALERLMAWPWKPMFRDDTCPVVTVVRRPTADLPRQDLVLTVDDRHWQHAEGEAREAVFTGGETAVDTQVVSAADLAAWLDEAHPNRRQRLVTNPVLYRAMEAALTALGAASRPLGDLMDGQSFGWSMQDLERTGAVHESETLDPDAQTQAHIFFQIQARVGKPVDYRQYRTTAGFNKVWPVDTALPTKKMPQGALRRGGVWVSQAIDRFPLVFVQDPADAPAAWLGVSKYLHLAAKPGATGVPDALWAAALTSTPALLAMERAFKEGTRKTLRRDENGYAKEVRKGDLMALAVPDLTRFSAEALTAMAHHQDLRGRRSLPRFDAAAGDADWLAIDRLILTQMGVPEAHQARLQQLALALYWRRMRHLHRYPEALATWAQG
jgi:hypothetical protein